ncbi:NmrA domain-containing protein [Trichoderma simmonsii]|uniref:NmrA domain-containing protein n=1 Tax=Trichoderma simmonsii TaxID=1491479 RepID=A0A8G0LSI5_9HYPO|nr:NmrA domain-containing protein [Trichoderma simmonsii]
MSRASSKVTFPENIRVYKTDYSEPSLISALEGHDAVVSTISGSGLKEQQKIIDAAILAGVKRFIPSEYGIDVCHPKAMEIVPFFNQKQQINAYLRSKESQGITWTSVATGPFLDWGLQAGLFGFDFKNRSATFVDEGTQPFSTTILPTVGKAIASVLTHASDTENKRIFVHSFRTTQKQLLEILEKQTGRQKMSSGQGGVFELLQAAMFKGGCGSDFETEFEVHNDLLELRPDNL